MLRACICQWVLQSNLLSFHITLSHGCPMAVFHFFTLCEGLRAGSLLLLLPLSLLSKAKAVPLPWIIHRKQGLADQSHRQPYFRQGEATWRYQEEERHRGHWERREDQEFIHLAPNTAFSKYHPTVLYLLQKTDDRWPSLTSGCFRMHEERLRTINSSWALSTSAISVSQGLIRPSRCPGTGWMHTCGNKVC